MWPKTWGVETYIIVYLGGVLFHAVALYVLARRMRIASGWAIGLGVAYLLAMFPAARFLAELNRGAFSVSDVFTADYWIDPNRWTLWGGPLAYLGFTVLAVLCFARDRRRVLDFAILPLPASMIIAKIACFANGCCFGRESSMPWAMAFPEGADAPAGVPIHPTQLYEIAVLILILVVFTLIDRQRWCGALILWFLVFYGVGRATTELFRAEDQIEYRWGHFSSSQWLCVVASLVAAVLLLVRRFQSTGALPSANDHLSPAPFASDEVT